MLRSLLVLCLVFASPALAQEYQSKELADAARDWRQELIDSVPANKKQPGLIAGWRRAADADYQAKRYAAAIDELTRAIANGADDGLVWLRLAQNELAVEHDHAMASAYNAYLKTTDPVERGVALFIIGRDYDRHDKQKEALAAFDAGLKLTQSPSVAERTEQLRRLVAFRVTKVQVQAESDWGRACLRFNEAIARRTRCAETRLFKISQGFLGGGVAEVMSATITEQRLSKVTRTTANISLTEEVGVESRPQP